MEDVGVVGHATYHESSWNLGGGFDALVEGELEGIHMSEGISDSGMAWAILGLPNPAPKTKMTPSDMEAQHGISFWACFTSRQSGLVSPSYTTT